MGKRVPQDERPYRPVEEALVRAVLTHEGEEVEEIAEANGTDGLQLLTKPLAPPHGEPASGREIFSRVPQDRPERQQAQPMEKLTREKRVLLTFSEEREIERLVARIAEGLGTPVKLSHLLRAYMTLLLHAENELVKRSHQVGPLHRPSNGDPMGLVRFEQRLAQILSAAFRDASPIR